MCFYVFNVVCHHNKDYLLTYLQSTLLYSFALKSLTKYAKTDWTKFLLYRSYRDISYDQANHAWLYRNKLVRTDVGAVVTYGQRSIVHQLQQSCRLWSLWLQFSTAMHPQRVMARWPMRYDYKNLNPHLVYIYLVTAGFLRICTW